MKEISVVTFRILVTLLLALVLATGCAQLHAIFKPSPPASVPVRPARQAPPPAPTRPTHQEPPPRLSPQISAEKEKQLTQEVNAAIQETERILLSVDRQKLNSDQWQTHQTVQSFLAQAREAMANKDFQQAMNLAQKAHVLSDELFKTVR
ncbi:MAG: hypothetical protein C3F08_03950 [Candidatus Methylomirabilota bacterium]|nr:MAG: hypothetical protein C3F08_03950 [candidate division NC10 bacterium]